MDGISTFIGWVAPILSTVIITAATASINAKMEEGERKRDSARAETEAKRKAEAQWRAEMEQRMAEFERLLSEQADKMDSVLRNQLTQSRSDIVHKAHRYLDDLGCASTEEKNAFDAEYNDYAELCEAYGIENDFVNNLHDQVMRLPGRSFESSVK